MRQNASRLKGHTWLSASCLLLATAINPGMAVLFAYFASRIVYGLNVDVSKAQRLGSYQLDSLLGRGGRGEAWRATHHFSFETEWPSERAKKWWDMHHPALDSAAQAEQKSDLFDGDTLRAEGAGPEA